MANHRSPIFTKATGGGALASLLVAGALLATGCGETTSGNPSAQAGATSSSASTTPTSATATTSTSGRPAPAKTSRRHSAPTGSSSRKGRAPLVLPSANSQPAPKLSSSERAHVSVADITLSSPAIKQIRLASSPNLAPRYTCRGTDESPPLHWTNPPAGTKELALFAISIHPVGGKLFFDWAIAGLSPDLHGLAGGAKPAGAVIGRNGYGNAAYSICPADGTRESYVFALYALPRSLAPKANFDPATLRQQAIGLARHTGLLVGTYG